MAEEGTPIGKVPVQELKEVQNLTKSLESLVGKVDDRFKDVVQDVQSISKELNNSLDLQKGSTDKAKQFSKANLAILNHIKSQNRASKLQLLFREMQIKASTKLTESEKEKLLAAIGFTKAQIKVNSLADKLIDKLKSQKTYEDGVNKALVGSIALFTALAGVAAKFGGMIDSIGQSFGSLSVMGEPFKNDLLDVSVEVTKLGGGIEDVASITSTLASNFGMNVDEAAKLSSKVFDTSKAIGLSAEEGANLFGVLTQTANLSADQAEKLAESTFQLARQAGVAPQAVMADIAGSTEEIAGFTKDGGDNIAEAAVQARQMGLSLSTTAKIAEGLLDFENSIAAEMEASVLIGKQLNFQRARELALSGDIAGATKNIVNQLGDETDFNALNLIQRQKLAQSIGVSVTELSKMVSASDKLTLSGALAGKSFGDLLGEDAISNISNIVNQFKALAAELITELGPTIENVLGQFRTFFEESDGLNKIKGFVQGIGDMLVYVANNIPTVIGLLVALKTASLGAAIASSIAGLSAVWAATLGVGVPIALGVLAAGIASATMMIPNAQTGYTSGAGNVQVSEQGQPEITTIGAGRNRIEVLSGGRTQQVMRENRNQDSPQLLNAIIENTNAVKSLNLESKISTGTMKVVLNTTTSPQGGEPLISDIK